MNSFTGKIKGENYFPIGIFLVMIIPLIAMIDYGLPLTFLEIIEEYIVVLTGFFWTPVLLLYAILDWDFEARFSPLLKIIFWIIPPLVFAYSYRIENQDFKSNILGGYAIMAIGAIITITILFILLIIMIFLSSFGLVPNPLY